MKFKAWIPVIAVPMILALAFVAEARPFGPGVKTRGMRGDLGGLRTLLELRLSAPQQEAMINIITQYQNERKLLRSRAMELRRGLSTVLRAEPFDEEQARKAFREASLVREEMLILNAKMMAELKTLLTPEQLELLKERKAQRMERLRPESKTE